MQIDLNEAGANQQSTLSAKEAAMAALASKTGEGSATVKSVEDRRVSRVESLDKMVSNMIAEFQELADSQEIDALDLVEGGEDMMEMGQKKYAEAAVEILDQVERKGEKDGEGGHKQQKYKSDAEIEGDDFDFKNLKIKDSAFSETSLVSDPKEYLDKLLGDDKIEKLKYSNAFEELDVDTKKLTEKVETYSKAKDGKTSHFNEVERKALTSLNSQKLEAFGEKVVKEVEQKFVEQLKVTNDAFEVASLADDLLGLEGEGELDADLELGTAIEGEVIDDEVETKKLNNLFNNKKAKALTEESIKLVTNLEVAEQGEDQVEHKHHKLVEKSFGVGQESIETGKDQSQEQSGSKNRWLTENGLKVKNDAKQAGIQPHGQDQSAANEQKNNLALSPERVEFSSYTDELLGLKNTDTQLSEDQVEFEANKLIEKSSKSAQESLVGDQGESEEQPASKNRWITENALKFKTDTQSTSIGSNSDNKLINAEPTDRAPANAEAVELTDHADELIGLKKTDAPLSEDQVEFEANKVIEKSSKSAKESLLTDQGGSEEQPASKNRWLTEDALKFKTNTQSTSIGSTSDNKLINTEQANSATTNAETVELTNLTDELVGLKNTETSSYSTKTVDGKTVDGKTVDGKTVDGKTVDGKTVDGKTASGTSVDNSIFNDDTFFDELLGGEHVEVEVQSDELESKLKDNKNLTRDGRSSQGRSKGFENIMAQLKSGHGPVDGFTEGVSKSGLELDKELDEFSDLHLYNDAVDELLGEGETSSEISKQAKTSSLSGLNLPQLSLAAQERLALIEQCKRLFKDLVARASALSNDNQGVLRLTLNEKGMNTQVILNRDNGVIYVALVNDNASALSVLQERKKDLVKQLQSKYKNDQITVTIFDQIQDVDETYGGTHDEL